MAPLPRSPHPSIVPASQYGGGKPSSTIPSSAIPSSAIPSSTIHKVF